MEGDQGIGLCYTYPSSLYMLTLQYQYIYVGDGILYTKIVEKDLLFISPCHVTGHRKSCRHYYWASKSRLCRLWRIAQCVVLKALQNHYVDIGPVAQGKRTSFNNPAATYLVALVGCVWWF